MTGKKVYDMGMASTDEPTFCPTCDSDRTERKMLPDIWWCADCGNTFDGPSGLGHATPAETMEAYGVGEPWDLIRREAENRRRLEGEHECDNPSSCTTCLNAAAAKSTARRTARKAARR